MGNLEVGIDRPNALMVDAENGQILGLDAVHVRSIRNRKGATLQVVNALGEKKISGSSPHRTGIQETHVG